jgi:hypothetical protein
MRQFLVCGKLCCLTSCAFLGVVICWRCHNNYIEILFVLKINQYLAYFFTFFNGWILLAPTQYRLTSDFPALLLEERLRSSLHCIISVTNGHASRTTEVPLASWITSSHERTHDRILTHSVGGQVAKYFKWTCPSFYLNKTIKKADHKVNSADHEQG